MIGKLQTMTLLMFTMSLAAADRLERRVVELREERERGGGRGSLEEMLLTVGGWAAAAVVVGGIGVAIAAALGKLK